MPKINEFFDKPAEDKPYKLEEIQGVRPCSNCDEDVSGALWDPVDFAMSWKCSSGHETVFRVN